MTRLGLISDTHGLLRPEACAALAGCDRIIHAGDIGAPFILDALSAIAPVTAVRGNNDRGAWARAIPERERLRIDEVAICVLHDVAGLMPDAACDARVVVSGHSHKPCVQEAAGVLFVNPGSAGPRRFRLPVSMAELVIDGPTVTAHIVHLALRDAG
jgi:putative phosphoesterase